MFFSNYAMINVVLQLSEEKEGKSNFIKSFCYQYLLCSAHRTEYQVAFNSLKLLSVKLSINSNYD